MQMFSHHQAFWDESLKHFLHRTPVTSSGVPKAPPLPSTPAFGWLGVAEGSSPADRSGCQKSVPSWQRPASPWWSGGGCPAVRAHERYTWRTHLDHVARSSGRGRSGAEAPCGDGERGDSWHLKKRFNESLEFHVTPECFNFVGAKFSLFLTIFKCRMQLNQNKEASFQTRIVFFFNLEWKSTASNCVWPLEWSI